MKQMKSEKSTGHSSVEHTERCRTCLSSEELQPLFPVKSKYRSFERALFLCTGLRIKSDDGLPQTICRPCTEFIESAIQFRNKSSASQANLIQRYKYKKKTSKSKEDKCSVERKYKQSEKLEISLENIDVQSKYTMDKDILDNDLNTENINSISPTHNFQWSGNEQSDELNLAQDKEEATSKKTTKVFMKKIKDTSYDNMMENSGDPKKPIRCKQCKKSMITLMGFKAHVKSHTRGIIKKKKVYRILCEHCGLAHQSQRNLIRHLQAKHGMARDDRYPCSYCDFRALDVEMLRVHERRIHTKERPFVCHDCGEAFYSNRVLRQHMDVHVTDKLFQCNLCQRNCKSKSRLTKHIFRVHRPRKYMYKCSFCTKTYVSHNKTRIHMVKIHGVPKNQQGKIERISIQEEDI